MDFPFFSQPRATWHDPAWYDPEAAGESLTAHDIYQRIRSGHGTATLDAACSASTKLAERYDRRTTQIMNLTQKMDAAWQGAASDSAQSALQPLVRAFQDAYLPLEASKDALDGQTHAFYEAFRNVEDISAQAPTSSLLDDLNPFATDTDRAITDYTHKASKNVAVYQSYSTQSADNGARMPIPYPLIEPDTTPPTAVQQPSGHTTTTWPEAHALTNPPSTAAPATNTNDQPPLPSQPAHQPDQQTVLPPQSPDDATTHTQSTTPDLTSGLAATQASDPRQWQYTPHSAPSTASGTGYDVGPAPARPDVTVDRSAPGTDRKTPGWRGTGGSAPGGRGIGSGRPGAGLRAGLGGGDPYWSTTRGATPSSTSAADYSGGTPWGTGADHSTGDGMHKRKYPVNLDPDSLFGSDEVVPPAVISVDDDTDWDED